MNLISPMDKTLSIGARGILSVMLNDISCDYCSLEKLYRIFPNENKDTIDNTMSELCSKEYVVEFKPSYYAVNKLKIHNMAII